MASGGVGVFAFNADAVMGVESYQLGQVSKEFAPYLYSFPLWHRSVQFFDSAGPFQGWMCHAAKFDARAHLNQAFEGPGGCQTVKAGA